jgi:hypothetical protein
MTQNCQQGNTVEGVVPVQLAIRESQFICERKVNSVKEVV